MEKALDGHALLLYNSLLRQHLLFPAPKAEVVSSLLGLQAQFAANPRISLRLRASDYSPDTWADGLVKIWSHRGTMYVVPETELGLHLAALDRPCGYVDDRWGMTGAEMRHWAPFIRDRVREGIDTRDGLKEACRAAGMTDTLLRSVFYGWGGLIKEMCLNGELVGLADRPRVYRVPEPPVFPDVDQARTELLRRYFTAFGPAKKEDARVFFNTWPAAQLDKCMERLRLSVLRMDGRTYYHTGELAPRGEIPPCVLVPGFDSLVLGYRDRGRMLDDAHKRRLVNVAGIVFPCVILRGRIRAAWKLDGEHVRVTPFETLLKKDEAAIRVTVHKKLGRGVSVVYES